MDRLAVRRPLFCFNSSKNVGAEYFAAYGELIVRLLPCSQAAGIFCANAKLLWQSSPALHASLGRSLTAALQNKRPLQLDGPRQSSIFVLPLLHAGNTVGAIAVMLAAGKHPPAGEAASISGITINTSESRYVWLPLRFDGDRPFIEWRSEWSLDEFS